MVSSPCVIGIDTFGKPETRLLIRDSSFVGT